MFSFNRLNFKATAVTKVVLTQNKKLMLGEVRTLHELGVAAGRVFGNRPSIGWKCAKTGAWTWTSFAERAAKARQCARGLESMGVRLGDRVAVISKNREEWVTAAYGCYGAGAALVPMYEQQTPKDWEFILRDSGAKVLFVSRRDLLEAARSAASGVQVVCFEDDSFASFLDQEGEARGEAGPDDLATLIYTSGTTGKPKGVELTHNNLLWNSLVMSELSSANMDRLEKRPSLVRSLSILPWAHIFGQTCELHAMTAMGHEVALASDATTFLNDCEEVQPTVLIAVPALYNRIFDGFEKTKLGMKPWQRRLADRGLELGDKKAKSRLRADDGAAFGPPLSMVETLQHAVLDRLVLSKVRAKLGGRITCLASGGAAISAEVRSFLESLGLPVANGYGLTETSPVLTYEQIDHAANQLPGSIGRPIPGVQLKTLDDQGRTVAGEPGEIVGASPGVMRGYWNRPDATAEVLYEEDGTTWFRTGDQGVMDPATSHVRIVGRIKEKYKLANGKYVVPTPLEESFARSHYISQVFMFGDNQPFNVALVSPDWPALDEKLNKRSDDSPIKQVRPFEFDGSEHIDALMDAHGPAVHDLIEAELRAHSACKNYEFPRKWLIVRQGFNAARSMVTPKLSLRRNNVLNAHKGDIDALYTDDDAAVAAEESDASTFSSSRTGDGGLRQAAASSSS